MAELGRASTSTMSFGSRLHIALITVTGLTLRDNTIYFYDINFGTSGGLAATGVLSATSNGISKITYGAYTLPSFILPSSDMESLKIMHGSCRKPHGGIDSPMDTDAIEAIDLILQRTHDIPQSTHDNPAVRPQQLYLTGDQIYADDVSDILLFMLRDAVEAIMGWSTGESLPSNPSQESMRPMHRLNIVTSARFTSGEVAESHLLLLGEFYAMYLFAWSKELWPLTTAFPSFNPEYSTYGRDRMNGGPFVGYIEAPSEVSFNRKLSKLLPFYNSLDAVRRVLANISTYMIFDDHEITDDWFLNRPWVDRVFRSTDGKRIIQNGLSAYGVFQGWGNKPEAFSTAATNENSLLNALITLNQHGETGASLVRDWEAIQGLVIPNISGTDLTGGIDWSYSLSFDKFNVIVLNSRTNRALYTAFSGLLSTSSIQSQIANRVSEKLPDHEFTLLVAPAPVFGLPFMEELVQPVVSFFTGPPGGDYEPWSGDRNKFEHFLREISAFRRVLLLSGDVHYSFSNAIDFWDNRSGAEVISKFVNLTSSSFKNSTTGGSGTTFLADTINNRIPQILLNLENDGLYVGWNTPGDHIMMESITLGGIPATVSARIRVDGRSRGPNIYHLVPYTSRTTSAIYASYTQLIRTWVAPGNTPDWEYKILFESDFRSDADRRAGTMPAISTTAGMVGTGARHTTLATTRGNHTVVGQNSVGEITFAWGSNESDKKIAHKMWTKVDGNFIPFTIHLVDFGIADPTDQKPSEIGRVS